MQTNRIIAAVAQMDERIAGLDADAIARLEEFATLDNGDWLHLGDKASRAYLDGKVSADEGQSLHLIHKRFHRDATLAERVTFLRCMVEVMA